MIQSTLFPLLVNQGATEQQAVCAGSTAVERVGEAELLALGLAEFQPEALAPIIQAGLDCGIEQSILDATVDAGLGG